MNVLAKDRGTILQTREIDMLSRNTTWTTSRDAEWGHFTAILFYDGQGFMVRKESGISKIQEMDGKKVCVQRGTTSELNVQDAFNQFELSYTPVLADSQPELTELYEQGQCVAMTTDKSGLAGIRATLAHPEEHIILDITISKEPLGPVVPRGDEQWLSIVKTVLFGLINAEELDITQTNVAAFLNCPRCAINPSAERLLGKRSHFGQAALGLEMNAIANAIRAVGNYGEIYNRHLGASGINIPRGINNLWNNPQSPGLIYAPPLR